MFKWKAGKNYPELNTYNIIIIMYISSNLRISRLGKQNRDENLYIKFDDSER
jgi:hypothetical protein